MEALKVVCTQLLKDCDKAPGWLPLLVCAYLMLGITGLPATVSLAGVTLPLSTEVLAGLVTLLFYQVGDAADEWVFKTGSGVERGTRPFYKQRYEKEQKRAQDSLGVTTGLYGVAWKLTDAAEKDRRTVLVHSFNEAAKFMRSVAFPLVLLSVLSLVEGRQSWAVTLTGVGLIAFAAYPSLKVQHIRRLYSLASLLSHDVKYTYRDLDQVRLFFWEGTLVASACRPDAPVAA